MKKAIKFSFLMMVLSGFGFIAYKISGKLKELKDYYDNTIFFNEKSLKYDGEIFEDNSYAVAFGVLDLDLTGAILDGDTHLDLYGEYCGIRITVPKDWNIRLVGSAERAGVLNRTKYNEDDDHSSIFTIMYEMKYAGMEVIYAD